jgi:hypothetical protein
MPTVRRLSANSPGYASWHRWIRSIGNKREELYRRLECDPIDFGENATVGLMLSAAGSTGLTGMFEYPTKKAADSAEWSYGRCDLWLLAARHADVCGWAFEVRQRRITSQSPRDMLIAPFVAAWRDAGRLDASETSMRLACTVFHSHRPIEAETECAETLRWLARQSTWSWRISHNGVDLAPVYIFIKHRRRE